VFTRLIDSLFAENFGTIQRTLLGELLRVFALCLIALSGVFTMGAVLQQFQIGTSLAQVLRILPLLTVTLLPYIVPPACLYASCVVYGRVAHDNEAVALKAAGVDLYTLLRPAVLLGLVAGAGTAAIQFSITPYAWRATREWTLNEPEEAICLALKKDRTIKIPSGKDHQYVLYVRDVEDRRLSDVILKVKTLSPGGAGGEVDLVARTREARLQVDLDRKLIQLEGTWAWTGGSRSGSDPIEHELPPQFNMSTLRASLKYNPAMIDWLDLPRVAAERLDQAAPVNRIREALAALPADKSLTPTEQAELARQLEVGVDQVPVDAAGRLSQLQHL
jgi:lipopolysaccharide export system permease protein